MAAATYKDKPTTQAYETKAKNLLKGELKRRGVTYAGLSRNWLPSASLRPNET